MNREPVSDSSFIYEGGNSLKALVFIDLVEDGLAKTKRSTIKINKLLDMLFNQNFSKLVEYLTEPIDILDDTHENTNINVTKRPRTADNTVELEKTNYSWISKHQSFNYQNKQDLLSNTNLNPYIKAVWRYNTRKCVDATPLIFRENDENRILIGSHSAEFFCLKDSGELVWSFKTKDRIESSAVVSKCGKFVIFGNQCKLIYIQKNTIFKL